MRSSNRPRLAQRWQAERAAAAAQARHDRERRRLLGGAGLLTLGLAGAWMGIGSAPAAGLTQGAGGAAVSHAFSARIDPQALGAPVNRRLLGHNVQWVDRGDDLLREDGSFEPRMLDRVLALGPTALRFPGGAQSDLYHWQRGIGPLAQRGDNEHFHARTRQPSVMGSAEFLALCEATGAEPLITVNLPSGSPEEAARWVHATNVVGFTSPRTGQRLPRVPCWEIGNEPYLKDEAQPALALEPEAFAHRADAFIRAMRAVDPAIRIGLPLSNAQRNGVPVVHFRDWLGRVLRTQRERIDFASVHNAYLPYAQELADDSPANRATAYWAAMAGARTVQADLDALGATLAALRPGPALPLALTEYHALFSLGHGARDDWVGSAAGALYVADLLRLLAGRPEMLMAHLWSLSGNWRFGAIHSAGFDRPVAQVLALMNQALRGRLVAASMQSPTVATRAAGLVAAQPALPLIETLATLETVRGAATLRVLLIHKDPQRPASGRIDIAGMAAGPARLTRLAATDVLRSDDVPDLLRSERLDLPAPGAAALTVILPPASISLLELPLVALPPAPRVSTA
ncbi:MAG: hypothetical protein ABI574_10060 [Burkholderiales bacterium]